jgi:cardiolipin synthase
VGGACGVRQDPNAGPTASSPAGAVRLVVEPDDGADAVLSLVTGARRSVWMEMYLLTDGRVIDALVARRLAGCDVRVLLEPSPYQSEGANQAAFDRLAAAGVSVQWTSPRFALTHAKVIIVDGARLAVLTLNLTRAGLSGNREYAVVDEAPRDVAATEALFASDATGAATPTPTPTPAAAAAAGRLLASPDGTRGALARAIAAATRVVTVEMEELSDAAAVRALLDAHARGVAVSVVLPASGRSSATEGAARRLLAAGVDVRALETPTVHAKAVVADGWLYLGSANLTTASLDANREIGLGLDDAAALRRVAQIIAGDRARAHAP